MAQLITTQESDSQLWQFGLRELQVLHCRPDETELSVALQKYNLPERSEAEPLL